MPISDIADNEAGSSVRTKLNDVIGAVNDLGGAAGLDVGTTAGTVAAGDDSRFTDARTPTAHAASHITGGSDAIQSATASQNGLATAAQITKLDGIKAGSDVTGPASSTDNALVRYDGTTGKLVQNSAATLTDDGTFVVSATGAQVAAYGAGGDVLLDASAGVSALIWRFDPGDGEKNVRLTVNESTSEDFTLKLPAAAGTVGQSLSIGSVSAPEITLEWSTGGDALTSDPLSQFAATTSDQLRGVISDETGSGALVFANSPTLVTPALGTPSSGVLTNCTGLPTAGLVDDAVTLAKMAAGTAGNLITYDASGNPAAVGTGTAGQRLTSNGTGFAPTFQSEALRIPIFFSDQSTDWTTGLKVTFSWRFGTTTLSSTPIDCVTAPTGSAAQFDVKKNGTTIFGTKPTIDATETTTDTAATPAAISTTSLANGDIVTIHIDQVGSTIKGQGGVITFVGTTIP